MILQVEGFLQNIWFLKDNMFFKNGRVIANRVVQDELVEGMDCDRSVLSNLAVYDF